MSYDPNLEDYIELSLANLLAADSTLGKLPLQRYGQRKAPPAGVKEWLAFNILSIPRLIARPGVWRGRVMFQVSCFTRGASERPDKATDRASQLGNLVARLFETKRVLITNPSSPQVTLASLSTGVPKIDKLPPEMGDNVWGAMVTFKGAITES